jgi:hypothetical protein
MPYWTNVNKQLYHPDVYKDALFAVYLEDVETSPYIHIAWEGDKYVVIRSDHTLTDKPLQINTTVNKYPFNERDHWITYNKCSLCRVCRMPEVELPA